MKLKKVEPSADQRAAREGVIGVLAKFGHMPADQLLAILAYTVGQMIALQDQRAMTPDQAMALVATNIESGNADAIANLMNSQGTA